MGWGLGRGVIWVRGIPRFHQQKNIFLLHLLTNTNSDLESFPQYSPKYSNLLYFDMCVLWCVFPTPFAFQVSSIEAKILWLRKQGEGRGEAAVTCKAEGGFFGVLVNGELDA